MGTLRARSRCLLVLPVLLAGCAEGRFLRQTCAERPAAADAGPPDPGYRVGCPDVLAVTFADRPDLDALAAIDLDGRLPLPELGRPVVAGESLDAVRGELARLAGVPADRVGVELAAPRSGRVYIHGPVRGRVRVVPYRGPEPVLALLRRTGGLPPGSKLSEVYVVRPNVAAGGPPEVFRVDVAAAVLNGDGATDVAVRPSDQVYVGETRGAALSRLLPHWLEAAYRKVMGLWPDDRVTPPARGFTHRFPLKSSCVPADGPVSPPPIPDPVS